MAVVLLLHPRALKLLPVGLPVASCDWNKMHPLSTEASFDTASLVGQSILRATDLMAEVQVAAVFEKVAFPGDSPENPQERLSNNPDGADTEIDR